MVTNVLLILLFTYYFPVNILNVCLFLGSFSFTSTSSPFYAGRYYLCKPYLDNAVAIAVIAIIITITNRPQPDRHKQFVLL